ncbi:cyclic nucleotide-gated cation channel alpha-3 isoform X1, partial [Tachysurus ichikawai]
LSHFLYMLRNWASHRLQPEVERPDSFLERFRGPELKDLSSRGSNARSSLGHPERPHKRNKKEETKKDEKRDGDKTEEKKDEKKDEKKEEKKDGDRKDDKKDKKDEKKAEEPQ